MRPAVLRRWGLVMAAISVVSGLSAFVLFATGDEGFSSEVLVFGWMLVSFTLTGAVLAARRPEEPVGWLVALVGLLAALKTAAALFNPLRRRVQQCVDRRFDRTRYDAHKVVEEFSARLRDEVDLQGLTDLTRSAWAREPSARPAYRCGWPGRGHEASGADSPGVVLFGATLAGVIPYGFLPAGTNETWEGLDPLAAAFLAMSLVGATIVWRTGGNRVGWVMVAIGAIALISAVGSPIAERASTGGSTGLAVAGFLVSDIFFIAAVVCTVVILPLLFPTGRPPTPGWAWVGWGARELWCATPSSRRAAHPERGDLEPAGRGDGARLFRGLFGGDNGHLRHPCWRCLGGGLTGGQVPQSLGCRTKQLSWLTFAMALVAVAIVSQEIAVAFGVDVPDAVENASFVLAVLVFPIAIGIAVLRYRLYEIDRLVRRTVSYTVVAVLLALVYLGGVAALGALVGSENPLAVAGATLAAAALFNPLRRRVQRWVDGRFDRGRYDAARVAEGFSTRLRDEVDLEGLTTDLTQSSARRCDRRRFRSCWWKERAS